MKNAHGWTLVELLTTLSIISLLFAIGSPSFNKSIKHHTETIALRTLLHLSYYARTQAIKRKTYFTLCPSHDQIHCSTVWNKKLIVFSDHNKNETVDELDVLYRTFSFEPNTPCIKWNRPTRQYLQFKPSGASNGTAGHFRFCDTVNSASEYKVVVSLNGRTSLKNL